MYTISHNSSWYGSFPTRVVAEKTLLKKGWIKVPKTKGIYKLRVRKRVFLSAEIICVARPNQISELPPVVTVSL
mgnify:FL=1